MKNNNFIKRVCMSIVIALCVFCSNAFVLNAEDNQNNISSVQPREILTGSYTKNIYADSNTKSVTVKIYYTYRYESSNSSKKYITGIQYGTITSYSGWKSVSGLNVSTNSVNYSNNNQTASFTVSYYGGMGDGNTSYMSSTVVISLI